MEQKRISLVGPTILIGLGIILLLNNLGYLNWTMWDALRLWPVLLIAAGLELLLGRRSIWGSLVAALLVLALIVGGVLLGERIGPSRAGEVVEIAHAANGAQTFTLEVKPAVVDLTIGSLSDSGNLVEGTLELWNNEALDQRFTEGQRARLVLRSEPGRRFSNMGLGQSPRWNLRVSPDVETSLSADLGIGKANLQLTGLDARKTAVDFGIGQIDVALSEVSGDDMLIDGGIGAITIVVPEGLGVRIITDTGLVTRNIPNGYASEGDTHTSPNWSQADYRTTITVSLGIGRINVVESAQN